MSWIEKRHRGKEPTWRVMDWVIDGNGARKRIQVESFKGKGGKGRAERRKALYDGDKAKGVSYDHETHEMTLQDAYDDMHEKRLFAPSTVSIHATAWAHVPMHVRTMRLVSLKAPTVQAVLSRVDKPVIREKVRLLISSLYSHTGVPNNPALRPMRKATRQERLDRGDSKGKRRTYLSEKELALLMANTPERYRALIELQARLGLRPGEAYSLKVGKFDSMKRRLLIDEALGGFTKTGQSRELVLPSVVAEILVAHIARFSDPSDPTALMFTWEGAGTLIDPSNFRQRVFYPARDAAGLDDKLTPNSLRHSAVSFAVANGATIYAVQNMVGHARPSITLDVYGSLWDSTLEDLAETLDLAIRASTQAAPQAPALASVTELKT